MPFSIVQAVVLLSLYFFDSESFVQFSFLASISIVVGVLLSMRCEYWEKGLESLGNFVLIVVLIAAIYECVVWYITGYHFSGVLLASNALQGLANKQLYAKTGSRIVYVLCLVAILPYLLLRTVDSAALSTGLPVLVFALLGTAGSFKLDQFWQSSIRLMRENFFSDRALRLNWFSSAIAIVNQNWLPLQGLIFLPAEFLAPVLFFWRAANFIPMFLSRPLAWKVYFHAKEDSLNPYIRNTFLAGTIVTIAAALGIYQVFIAKLGVVSNVFLVLVILSVVARYASSLLTHALAYAKRLEWGVTIQLAFLAMLITNALVVSEELLNYNVFVTIQLVVSTIVALVFYRLYTIKSADVL